MNETHIERIADELTLAQKQVQAVALLLEEGATIPFIARYRKEATNSLDEVAITAIRDRIEHLAELDSRRDAIFRSLEERGLLTDELKRKLDAAETMAVLEDLYLPFRPKRRTRATIAKERGLEPLAQRLFSQDVIDPVNQDPLAEAAAFINPGKGSPFGRGSACRSPGHHRRVDQRRRNRPGQDERFLSPEGPVQDQGHL